MRIDTILVPVDFSDHSARALDTAIELAKEFDARLCLLHCYQMGPGTSSPYSVALSPELEREFRESALRRVRDWAEKAATHGIEATGSAKFSCPSEGIKKQADTLNADLIVMGTRGLTGLKHVFLGSVAERTIRQAPCPVLTVRSGTRWRESSEAVQAAWARSQRDSKPRELRRAHRPAPDRRDLL